MEWLTNLLGFSNQGSSPFGALGGASNYSGPTGNIGYGTGVGATGPIPATQPQASGGMQLPGIWGKLLGQQQGGGGQSGLGGGTSGGQNALLSQALGLMKPPPISQPQWMNLLSGPRG